MVTKQSQVLLNLKQLIGIVMAILFSTPKTFYRVSHCKHGIKTLTITPLFVSATTGTVMITLMKQHATIRRVQQFSAIIHASIHQPHWVVELHGEAGPLLFLPTLSVPTPMIHSVLLCFITQSLIFLWTAPTGNKPNRSLKIKTLHALTTQIMN